MLPCFVKAIFGIDCPVCGFQRSMLLLLKGEYRNSFLMYPPLLFILALLVILAVRLLVPGAITRKIVNRYAAIVLIVIGVNYAVKLTVFFV